MDSRTVGNRQRNPSGGSEDPPVERRGKTPQEMGDRPTTDHASGHMCPAVRQKLDHRKDQIQWHRIRSNKVGVDEGGGGGGAVSIDVVREVDERGGESPAPCSLSAKFRSGSGSSSQFREVDFSDQVQGVGSAALERPQYLLGDPIRYGRFARQPSEGERGGGGGGRHTENEAKDEIVKRNKDNVHRVTDDDDEDDGDDGKQKELRILKNGDEVGRITVIKGKVQVSEGPNGYHGGEHRIGDGTDGVIVREGVYVGMDGGIEVGGGGVGVGAEELDERVWVSNGGNLVRRVVPVPQSLVLKEEPRRSDYPRFSSGAGTSQVCIPNFQASTDSFTTGATELSSGSTRGGTTTTAAEGDEEAPKYTRPVPPAQDEQEKPTLTPTSLAIYSSIQQQGSSRSGTCILFSTAVCTFLVTLVLTVAILIAPKTLASRGEDQNARAAPVFTTTTNSSDAGASHSALHAQTLTRVLNSVRAPTSPTPTTSSIPTTSAASSTPTILQDSQNTTEMFGDALRTR